MIAGIQIGDARRFSVPCDQKHPILYNPVITKMYDPVKKNEDCLSFPGMNLTGVPRYRYVEFTYLNEDWEEVNAVAGDDPNFFHDTIMAQAVQHEVDHFSGKLFFDDLSYKAKFRAIAEAHRCFAQYTRNNKRVLLHEGPTSTFDKSM